ITNEIQDLSLSGDNLTITGNASPTTIDLSAYLDNTDLLTTISGTNGQVLTHDGLNWAAANLPADGDTDDAIELQDLDLTGNTLTISGFVTPTDIDLAPYLDNTDLLASISGTNGQVLTHDGSNWAAANLPADGDTDDANELQDLDLTGNILTISGLVTPTNIDLAPYLDNTDLLASISGTNGQVLTHDGSNWAAANLPADGDTDDANELQDLDLTGNTLTISGLVTPTDIDLAPYLDNTDLLASISGTNGQVLTHDGSNWAAANLPADGDTDDANELQDLDLTGNILTISGLVTPTDIDLAPYLDNTDLLASISGTLGQVLTHNGTTWSAGPADGDSDDTNELQDLNITGDILTITGTGTPTDIDLTPYKDSPLTEGTDGIGTYAGYAGHIKVLNVINTVSSLIHSNLTGSVLTSGVHNHAKTVMLDVSGAAGSTATISEIDAGLNGQEMMIVCTGGTLVFDNSMMNGSNLMLPSTSVSIPAGGSIKLMYVTTLGNWIHMESVTTVVNPN
ncbi:MAG: hypothetical protein RLO17_07180, partial [Cyclobacteriaceae bacterium]